MRFATVLKVVAFTVVFVIGCWVAGSPLMNPPTGPGTPYPCPRVDDMQCPNGLCCLDGAHCEQSRGWHCVGDPMPADTEWLSVKKPDADAGSRWEDKAPR